MQVEKKNLEILLAAKKKGMIGGDFNCNPNDLEDIQELIQEAGWVDVGKMLRGGEERTSSQLATIVQRLGRRELIVSS